MSSTTQSGPDFQLDEQATRNPGNGKSGCCYPLPIPETTDGLSNMEILQIPASRLHELKETVQHYQRMDLTRHFAAGISHDLNNILLLIRLNVDLLAEQKTPDTQQLPRFKQINQLITTASKLSNQLVTFNKNSGAPRWFNPNETVMEVVSGLGGTFSLDTYIDLNLLATEQHFGDQMHLEQILLNLLLNAHHESSGKGNILVSIAQYQDDTLPPPSSDYSSQIRLNTLHKTPYLVLAVEDQGSGIPEAVLPRVFDAFFTTRPGKHHSGMGLAMVKNIVEQNQGSILVETTPGKGSCFTIYLPGTLDTICT